MQQWLDKNLDSILVGVLIAVIVGVLGGVWRLLAARVARASPAPPPRKTPAVAPRSSTAALPDSVETILSLDMLQMIKSNGEGFIVITDSASGPRLHTADCSAIREENFREKVLINGMRNGKYLWTATEAVAEQQWPKLMKHSCVSSVGRS